MTNNFLGPLRQLWLKVRRRSSYVAVRHVTSMNELPAHLGAFIYLVVRDGVTRWAVIECPCRCGARIQINLMRSRRPFWALLESDGKATFRPSLWRSGDTCGSHFFIEKNKVKWVQFG
jgi:hypothetical protein